MSLLEQINEFCVKNDMFCAVNLGFEDSIIFKFSKEGRYWAYSLPMEEVDYLRLKDNDLLEHILNRAKKELTVTKKEDDDLCKKCKSVYPMCPAEPDGMIVSRDGNTTKVVFCEKFRQKCNAQPFSALTEEFKDEV